MELAEFVMRQYDGVYRYIAYRMHGSDGAADVTQEVFLKFCGHFERELPRQPRAYLFAMARNEIAEYFRRTKKEESLDEALLHENMTEDLSEELIRRETVRNALRELPAEMREALVLRYLCDLSVREIAAALEIPAATVKTRLRRGKANMKILLEGGKTK